MNNYSEWPDFQKDPNAEEFRKLFVGGLDGKTTEETLKDYFSSYGTIEKCEIMKDKGPNPKSKGFAFITFASSDNIDEIQKNRPHEIDGRKIETKRATPKSQQYWATTKLYIKDFPKDEKEDDLTEELKEVFGAFGTIKEIKLIKEKDANLKGFGFIEFDDEDPVDKCNLMRTFKVKGSDAKVSKAYPQDNKNQRGRMNYGYGYDWDMGYGPAYDYYGNYGRPHMFRGGRGGDYGGYGGYDYYSGQRYQRGGSGRPYRGGRY